MRSRLSPSGMRRTEGPRNGPVPVISRMRAVVEGCPAPSRDNRRGFSREQDRAAGSSRSLSALGGGEGWGEVGDARAPADTHLTLPIASRRIPSLSPLKGGEGL